MRIPKNRFVLYSSVIVVMVPLLMLFAGDVLSKLQELARLPAKQTLSFRDLRALNLRTLRVTDSILVASDVSGRSDSAAITMVSQYGNLVARNFSRHESGYLSRVLFARCGDKRILALGNSEYINQVVITDSRSRHVSYPVWFKGIYKAEKVGNSINLLVQGQNGQDSLRFSLKI